MPTLVLGERVFFPNIALRKKQHRSVFQPLKAQLLILKAASTKQSSVNKIVHLRLEHYNSLCQFSASITEEEIAVFLGADKKSFDAKLEKNPLLKETVDTCVHAVHSARSQLKLSLAEISMAQSHRNRHVPDTI